MPHLVSCHENKTDNTSQELTHRNSILLYRSNITLGETHSLCFRKKTGGEHAKNVFHSLDCVSPETHLAKEEIRLIGFGRIMECWKMFPKGALPDTANKRVFV